MNITIQYVLFPVFLANANNAGTYTKTKFLSKDIITFYCRYF